MPIVTNQDQDDEQGNTMNVLSPQQAGQQMQSEAPTSPQSVSGTPAGGTGEGTKKASQKAKKGVGSGAFTDFRKYVQANKGAGQRMGQAAQKKFQTRAQRVGQQVQAKQQSFSDKLEEQRRKITEAGQFGQQALGQATGAVDRQAIEARRSALQERLGQFAPLQEGGYQEQIAATQAQLPERQAAFEAEQARMQEELAATQSQLGQLPSEQDQNFAELYRRIQQKEGSAAKQQEDLAQFAQQYGMNPAEFVAEQQRLQGILSEQQAGLGAFESEYGTTRSALEGSIPQLQELQSLYERRGALQTQEADLADILSKAPEELTEQDISRYRDIVEGRERYDTAVYGDVPEQQRAAELARIAGGIERAPARAELLRETLAGPGQYTRGQLGLDALLLQSDPEALRSLTEGVRGESAGLQEQIASARREALRGMGTVGREQRALQQELQTGAEAGKEALVGELEELQASDTSGVIGKLKEEVQSGFISDETKELLDRYNIDLSNLYNVDVLETLGTPDMTREEVGTASDLARAGALSQLAGTEQDVFLDPTRLGEVGKSQAEALTGLGTELREVGTKFEQARTQAADQLYQMHGGEIQHVVPTIQKWVESGYVPSERDFQKLRDSNYWAWAGKGKHGVATPEQVFKDAYASYSANFGQAAQEYQQDDVRKISQESTDRQAMIDALTQMQQKYGI